jgi:hypothetical protein
MNEPRLGVDFGRVINEGSSQPGGADTTFLNGGFEAAMRTPAMPGSIDVLSRLVPLFGGRVWIVSKCGERIQERTRQWLDHNDFWSSTGISPSNKRFCRQRADKVLHCKQLGITHFIDDRRDVLEYMRGVVAHLYLFGPQKSAAPTWVTATPTWADVELAVTAGIAAAPQPPATRRSR